MKNEPILITVVLFSIGFWFSVAVAPPSPEATGDSLPRLEIGLGLEAASLGLAWSTSAVLEDRTAQRPGSRGAIGRAAWVEGFGPDIRPRDLARGGVTAVRAVLRVARALLRDDHRDFPW